MDETNPQQERENYRRAVQISEEANPLPQEAERSYQGPDALGQAIERAAVFATVGWIAGHWLGGLGSEQVIKAGELVERRTSFKAKNIGAASALMGGVMGAYGAVKDTRYHRKQVTELQDALRAQHAKVGDLKDELRRQLSGSGRLKEYDPTWESGTEDKEKKTKPSAVALSANEHQNSLPESLVLSESADLDSHVQVQKDTASLSK
jgi:hypothetical protein